MQERHLALVRKLEQEGELSETHHKYIMAAQYAASGSEFWSIFAPRYPTKADLNQPECVLVDGAFRYETVDGPDAPSEIYIANGNHVTVADDQRTIDVEPVSTIAVGGVNIKGAKIVNGLNGTHNNGVNTKNCIHHINASNGINGASGVHDVNSVNGVDGVTVNATDVNSRNRSHIDAQGQDVSNEVTKPPNDIVLAPYEYVASLPSKKIRDAFIDALNSWLEIPQPILSSIKKIIGMLHHSSLMLDDIEDDSKLRRGRPATHMLFGTAQTINSANYAFVNTFAELSNLRSPAAPAIFVDEIQNMHCGQAFDLHWKYHTHCPAVDEYMMMIDNKTGALFRLCVRLMQAESPVPYQSINPNRFVTLLGRYFQLRDDYQNLTADEYTQTKGFCEDLDEGKISLPLIYTLQHPGPHGVVIRAIFQNKAAGELPLERKTWILTHMRETGALQSTLTCFARCRMNYSVSCTVCKRDSGPRIRFSS